MIEDFTREYLDKNMDQPVSVGRPSPMPPRFCAIQKGDSQVRNLIPTATITVYSYAPTEFEAASMNQTVKAQMLAMAELPEICRVQLDTDFSSPDTEVKSPRYQAIFYVTYYESEV